MAINFPPSPTVGSYYQVGKKIWQWNGAAWIKYDPITLSTSTVSTSTATGAVVISGGLGVSGALNVASTATIGGSNVLTTASILTSGDISLTESGGTITLTSLNTLQSVTTNGSSSTNAIQLTNLTNSTSTVTGALVVSGGIGVGKDVTVAGTVTAEHLRIQDAVMDSRYTTTATTATVVIDQYPTNIYRSAKYLVQVEEDVGPTSEFQLIEILLLVTNNNDVLTTDYGLITSNGELGSFSSEVDTVTDPSDPQLKLYFSAYTATNKVITVCRTAVTK